MNKWKIIEESVDCSFKKSVKEASYKKLSDVLIMYIYEWVNKGGMSDKRSDVYGNTIAKLTNLPISKYDVSDDYDGLNAFDIMDYVMFKIAEDKLDPSNRMSFVKSYNSNKSIIDKEIVDYCKSIGFN